ncbi:hypothetical protein GCM10029964_115500 [Kibdelosporangium lantanae]
MNVFVRDPDGTQRDLGSLAAISDYAGSERWRTQVWGSDVTRGLGATLLPRLASGDPVTIEPNEIAAFLRECNMVRANLDRYPDDPDGTSTRLEYERRFTEYLAAFQIAAARAQEVDGGLYIG